MRGFERPRATVLPDAALVPAANLTTPPVQFTHRLLVAQPYYYALPEGRSDCDGHFEAGTPLVLRAHAHGPWCEVVDGRGLRVLTAFKGLSAE
jgi:hypothetical protein